MDLDGIELKHELEYENSEEMQELLKKGESEMRARGKLTLEKIKIENKKQCEVRQKAVQLSRQLQQKNIPHKIIKRVLNNEKLQKNFYQKQSVNDIEVENILEKAIAEKDIEPIITDLKTINNEKVNDDVQQAESPQVIEQYDENEQHNNKLIEPEEMSEKSEEVQCLEEFTVKPEEALEVFEQVVEDDNKQFDDQEEQKQDQIDSNAAFYPQDTNQSNKHQTTQQQEPQELSNSQGNEQNDINDTQRSNSTMKQEDQNLEQDNCQINDKCQDKSEENLLSNDKTQIEESNNNDQDVQQGREVNIEDNVQNQQTIEENNQETEQNLTQQEPKEEPQNTKEQIIDSDEHNKLSIIKNPKQSKYTEEQEEEARKIIEEVQKYVVNDDESESPKVTQVRIKKGKEIKQRRRSFDQDDFQRDNIFEENNQFDQLSNSSSQFAVTDDEKKLEMKEKALLNANRKNKKIDILSTLKLPPRQTTNNKAKKQKKKKQKQELNSSQDDNKYDIVPDQILNSTTMLFNSNILEPLSCTQSTTLKMQTKNIMELDRVNENNERSRSSKSIIEQSTSYDSDYCLQHPPDDEQYVVKIETTRKNKGTVIKSSTNNMIDESVEQEKQKNIKLNKFLRSLEDKNLLKQRNIKYTKNSLEYKIYKQKQQYQKFKIRKSVSAPDIQLKFVTTQKAQLEFKPGFLSVLPCNPIINMLYGRANLRAAQQIQELDLSQQYDVKFANLDLAPGKFLYGKYFIDLMDTTIKHDVLHNYNVEFMKLIIPAMQGIFEAGYGLQYQDDDFTIQEVAENNLLDYDLEELNQQIRAQKEVTENFAFLNVFAQTQLYLQFLPFYINKFNKLFRQHIPKIFINLIKQQIEKGKPVRINDLHTYPVCYVWAYYLKTAGSSIYNYFRTHMQPVKKKIVEKEITLQQLCCANKILNNTVWNFYKNLLDNNKLDDDKEQEKRKNLLNKLASSLPIQDKRVKKRYISLQVRIPMNKIFDTLKEQEYSFKDITYKPNAHLYEMSLFFNIFFNGFENKIDNYIIRRSKDLLSSLNQHQMNENLDPTPSLNDIIISTLVQDKMMKQFEYSESVENSLRKEALFPQQDSQQTLVIDNQCVSFPAIPGNFSIYIKPQGLYQDQANIHIIDVLLTLGYKTDVKQRMKQLDLVDFSFLTTFIQFTQNQLDISVFYYRYIKYLQENEKFNPKRLFQLLLNLFLINEKDVTNAFHHLCQFEYILCINNNYYLALSKYSRHLQGYEQYFIQQFLDKHQKDCFITHKLQEQENNQNQNGQQQEQLQFKNNIQDIQIKDPKVIQEQAYLLDQITAYTKQKPVMRIQNILSRKGTRDFKQNKLRQITKYEDNQQILNEPKVILSNAINQIDFFVENPFTEYKKQLALLCQDPEFWKQNGDIDVQ